MTIVFVISVLVTVSILILRRKEIKLRMTSFVDNSGKDLRKDLGYELRFANEDGMVPALKPNDVTVIDKKGSGKIEVGNLVYIEYPGSSHYWEVFAVKADKVDLKNLAGNSLLDFPVYKIIGKVIGIEHI